MSLSPYSASAPVSPVRMRMTCSRSNTKTLPSPILPVLADFSIASITCSSISRLDRGFDFHLGQEIDHVLRAPVELGVALLPAESFHFGDGDAGHADRRERFTHFVELEGLDDCGDQFHCCSLSDGSRVSGAPGRGLESLLEVDRAGALGDVARVDAALRTRCRSRCGFALEVSV